MASNWVKFRDKITGSLKTVILGSDVVEAGKLANDIADTAKEVLAVEPSYSKEDILAKVLDKYNAKNRIKLPPEVIPAITDLVGLAVLEVQYKKENKEAEQAQIKDLISASKRKIVEEYKSLGKKLGKQLLYYLIEKFILKGKIL